MKTHASSGIFAQVSLSKKSRKGGASSALGIILKIGIPLIFLVIILTYLPSQLKSGWETIKELLGISKSIDEFENSILKKEGLLKNAITSQEQVTAASEIVSEWNDFKDTKEASEMSSSTKKIIGDAQSILLADDIAAFTRNGCLQKIDGATATLTSISAFSAECTRAQSRIALASQYYLPLRALNQEQYDTLNIALNSTQNLFDRFAQQQNLPNSERDALFKDLRAEQLSSAREAICSSMRITIAICPTLDEMVLPGVTIPDGSACSWDYTQKTLVIAGC